VEIPATGTGYVETPPRSISPGQRVTASYAHKESNISSIKLVVVWYRDNLHIIDEEEFDLTPSDTWVVDSRTVVAPTSAAYVSLRLTATAGSGSPGHVYVDSIFIDLVGQILRTDGAGNIKTVDPTLDAIIDNIKGARYFGVKDLDLTSTDPELTIPSGVEVDFIDLSLANKYFNYGVTRCHSNCLLKTGGKLKLCAGSVFKFVR